jgi:AcrR family transcriptional regulator
MKTLLSPRKSPRQARSQATVEAILDAAARVLVERGYAATNTNLVAERAGVSVGSLYQYFPNKDSLITALHDRHSRQMNEVINEAFDRSMELNFDDALTTLIEGLVESHRLEAGLHRVLEMQLAGHEDLDSHAKADAAISKRIVELMHHYRDDINVPHPELAAFTLMHSLHGLVHAVVLDLPEGVPLEHGTREIVRMARAYLQAES